MKSDMTSFRHAVTSSLIVGSSEKTTGHNDPADDCLVLQQGDFVPWDNPENILSKQTEYWITLTISAVGIPSLWLVGVVGNALSAAVFFRQGLGTRINLCLFCLAVADLLSITVLFLSYFEAAYKMLVGPMHFFVKYIVGLTGFTFLSQMLSVVIACERCFCVVSPLKAQQLVGTRKMAAILGVTSFLLMGGFVAVVGAKHTVICVTDPLTNVTTEIVYVTSYYLDNQEILDIFDVFVYSTAFPTIFLVAIIVTTTVTASKLRTAVRWRHQTVLDVTAGGLGPTQGASAAGVTTAAAGDTKKAQSGAMAPKEVALTRMLMATSVLFVLCLAPTLLVQLATFLVSELRYNGRYHNLVVVLWALVSLCKVLNSSLNFFVYYAMGSRFRNTLYELLPCASSEKASSATAVYEKGHAAGISPQQAVETMG